MGKFTIIDQSAKIGNNVHIGNYCEIRENCEIGDNTSFGSRCTLAKGTKIGKNCIIKYGFCAADTPSLNSPDFKSKVIIGNNVRIGANVIIIPPAVICDNSRIDSGLIINRDVEPGEIVRNHDKLR